MQLVKIVMALADELCGGKLVTVLEGGYHLEVLSHCILSTLRLLSGSEDAMSDPFGLTQQRERDITALLGQLRNLHGIREMPFHSIS